MTNNNGNGNRGDELETIKEILLTVARRAEATDARLDRLAESQGRTQEQLDALREDVEIAFQTISLITENSDREMAEFRSAILENQEENRRIWEYLMGQPRNGNGGEPQA